MGRWKTSKRWAAGVLAGLVIGLYFWLDPARQLFPRCPFLLLTGFKCPGCGSQRAFHQLLHGEVAAAGHANGLFVVALPYILFGLVLEYSAWGRRQWSLRRRWYGYRASLVAFAVVVLFGVLRNVWNF